MAAPPPNMAAPPNMDAPAPTMAVPPPTRAPAAPTTLAAQLTASGGAESVGFLNDLVAGLWPNIRVAAAKMIQEIADPIFASTLPSPLNTIHFTKVELGQVPMTFHNVDVHRTDNNGLKLDLDVNWDGECDMQLDGKMIPAVGVKHVKLQGRLSILLCPLTNVIPLIGAAQVAFINQPKLQLDFTNAASIADVSMVDKAVRGVIDSIIASMAVLPNRFLLKLDATQEIFNIYQHPAGVLRLTVEAGENLGKAKEGKGLLGKMTHDEPDPYVKAKVASETFTTKAIDNNRNPQFNESNDFIVADYDQNIEIDVKDKDTAGDDDIGIGNVSIKKLLLNGGRAILPLTLKDQPTESRLAISGKFFNFVPDTASFNEQGPGLVGVMTILIGSVRGLKGDRTKMKPSVKITWGDKTTFRTGIKSDAPGMDMENPAWDVTFSVPLKAGMIPGPPVKFTLMDAENEQFAIDVPLEAVLQAPNLMLQDAFPLGEAKLRGGIWLRGLKAAAA